MNLTDRQRFALEHPTDRSDFSTRPPPEGASRRHGKWFSILEVGRGPEAPWLWMASVSRQRAPGRPYLVGQWKDEWFAEADELLRELLCNVGAAPYDVEGHMSGAGLHRDQLAGYHRWRVLTPAELVSVEWNLTVSKELEGT